MRLKAAYRGDQFQPCADSSLRVVLMGLGIPKVDQDPIAHVLSHEAAEALHGLGNAFLVGRNDLAQVLRVHARRQCR